MVEWGGWKAATLFINKWGNKRTNPVNRKTKDKLSRPNRAALKELRQKNIINSEGASAKNSSLPRREDI